VGVPAEAIRAETFAVRDTGWPRVVVVKFACKVVRVLAAVIRIEAAVDVEPAFTPSPLYTAVMLYAVVLKGRLMLAEAEPDEIGAVA
jgi:hypothetical protein